MMNVRNNRYPFTATQWQELEHQALIFKHMVSGDPVPTHLLSTLKTSFNSSSTMFPRQPIGWGSFEMGLGRKVDTEPWRCRRTDGKKWRCSKEAHQDSKYCERHMHRGRNRSGSRKPVELSITPSSPKYPSSSQSSTTYQFFLGSGSSYSHTDKKDYRYLQRMGDGGERDFFPKALKSERSLHESYAPLTTTGNSREQEKQHQETHNKPFHHFLSEWNPKSRVSNWLDNKEEEDNQLKHSSSVSNTQLSISMPSSTQELFQQKARLY